MYNYSGCWKVRIVEKGPVAELMAKFNRIETMSSEKAREWFAGKKEGDVTVLDVRQPQEYRSGHLPGAVFIPLPELPDRTKELDPSKPVLAYCRSGNRSRAAAALLLTEGFPVVFSLEGGITAWQGEVATGEYEQGLSLLRGRETAEQLISLAWALEEGSRVFYERAVGLAPDSESADLFRRLAAAEAKHKSNILRAYKMVAGDEVSEDFFSKESLKGVMEGGTRVEDAISFLREKNRTFQDLIEVSMQVEANALDLYARVRRGIKDESAKAVFLSLIEEEKWHLAKLGGLLGKRMEEWREETGAGQKETRENH
jgi:rhodanese-related sulfurtransferase/rubrerythrin